MNLKTTQMLELVSMGFKQAIITMLNDSKENTLAINGKTEDLSIETMKRTK